jgi:hypothetical protein
VLRDPSVSRIHASLSVSPSGDCSVTDRDSHNGVDIDGVGLHGSQPVDRSAVVRFGDTACVIGRPPSPDQPAAIDPLRFTTPSGVIPFNRPPRRLPPAVEPREIAAPSPPAKGASSPFSVAARGSGAYGWTFLLRRLQGRVPWNPPHCAHME